MAERSPSPILNTQNGVSQQPSSEAAGESKPENSTFFSRLKKFWENSGLNTIVILTMLKAAIPPTIAIAIYQASDVAYTYTTLGYLVAIVSVFGLCTLPRAKFLQALIYNLLAICLSSCLSLLMIFCAVRARQNTEVKASESALGSPSPGAATSTYNPSASAVVGIWLFFLIYCVNAIRMKYPQFNFPVIISSIFIVVSSLYGQQFATMTQGIAFMKRLMEAFFTGLAIATGTSFLIFPATSRTIAFTQMTGYIEGLRAALKAQSVYFGSIETRDMFGRAETVDEMTEKRGKKGEKIFSEEAEVIKQQLRKVTEMHGKLHAELPFAKREIAIGYLGPEDLKQIFSHLRQIVIPVVGLGSIVDVFERVSDYNKWNEPLDPEFDSHSDQARERIVREWNHLMVTLHEPFANLIQVMDEGLLHVLYQLKLVKRPKVVSASPNHSTSASETPDTEAKADATAPGEEKFAEYLERKAKDFKRGKAIALRAWCEQKNIAIPPELFDDPKSAPVAGSSKMSVSRRSQRQLYMLLHMEYLLYSATMAILDFVRFADERVASGKLSQKRLVIPGNKRLIKWVKSVFTVQDSTDGEHIGDIDHHNSFVELGQSFNIKKDPEHLPPETIMERLGDKIRFIPNFLRSSESAFGLRVACATMSIAIISLLEQTQVFFVEQRLVWAAIMVAISMTPTAGQSIFSFILRLIGTVISMVASFLVWYIPGKKTPGVIVFLFLYTAMAYYLPITRPRYVMLGMINIVTTVLIVSYELVVRKIGEALATSNGQLYYPIYLLGPFRLATVAGGLTVAFFWTIFPYPISEHSVLRKTVGASLYLLANYYSIVHETLNARVRGEEPDQEELDASFRKLEKARNKVFSKLLLMLNSLRTYGEFQKWEIPIGGKFPKQQYELINKSVQNIVNYVSLAEYASRTFTKIQDDSEESGDDWFEDFKRVLPGQSLTTHDVTSILALLSASIINQQPLPPYLKTPRPYSFDSKLRELDRDILSIRHSLEPGYSAFSVIQLSSRLIISDLEKLIINIKALVGELDFSFHVVSTTEALKSTVTFSNESISSARPKRD